MRWTRNLVVTIAVLFVGLFFSSVQVYLHAGSTPAMNLPANVASVEGTEVVPSGAVIPEKEGRDSFIAMMKNELAKRVDEIITPEPVVTVAEEETESNEDDNTAVVERREVVWCDATVLESQIAASWPKLVRVVESGGVRLVTASASMPETASGTAQQSTHALMQLPISPTERAEPSCLTNGYIGVTADGRLIHNNDTILYTTYSESQLVGYAFDGHPIYGVSDSPEIDRCGGQTVASGYQYNLRSGENFIIGCFVSEPQSVLVTG